MAATVVARIDPFSSFHDRNQGMIASEAIVTIRYKVESLEWDHSPSWCDINDRYGLGVEVLEATLAANGSNGGCANPTQTIAFGQEVRLAIAMDPKGRCTGRGVTCAQPAISP